MGSITQLTEATFDEEIGAATEPVIVDFWAEWCGPCKMIAPILEEIAGEQEGKVRVAKVNVDDHPGLARKFSVMSIPTMIVFKDGQEDHRIIGAKGKPHLREDLTHERVCDARPPAGNRGPLRDGTAPRSRVRSRVRARRWAPPRGTRR